MNFANRNRTGLAAVTVFALVAVALAWYIHRQFAWRDDALREARAAASLAAANAQALADRLGDSRVELGRTLVADGDVRGAEDLIWPEYVRRPEAPAARGALWELLTHPGCVRPPNTFRDCRARTRRPDGEVLLATGDDIGRVRGWEMVTGRVAFDRPTSIGGITSMSFNPDGSELLIAGPGGIRLLSAADGHDLPNFAPIATGASCAERSQDGRLIASVGHDGAIHLWDATTWGALISTPPGRSTGRFVRFNRTATRLAASFDNGEVRLFAVDGSTGPIRLVPVVTIPARTAATGVGFNPDGTMLAAGTTDESLRFWKSTDGSEIPAPAESRGR